MKQNIPQEIIVANPQCLDALKERLIEQWEHIIAMRSIDED